MVKVYQNIKLNNLPKVHYAPSKKKGRCIDCGVVFDLIGDKDIIEYDIIQYRHVVENIQKYGYCACVPMIKTGVKK